ncbi:MAG: MFS transporter [Armatimonadota bacterium]|nr:MFS transporter [Armatimonadota bacterium]
MSIRWRLSLMMFLQYAIWGAWAPVLGAYLEGALNVRGVPVGVIFSLLPLATIVSPFIFGQVADRWFATERVMAVLHVLAGISMLWMSMQTSFSGMVWLMAAFSLFYAPTLALSNSICFSHMKNSEKEFGGIRVWGTIGWITAGWVLASVRGGFGQLPTAGAWNALSAVMGTVDVVLKPFAAGVHAVMTWTGGKADLLTLSGLAAVILGLFSLALPHTPPKKEAAKPLAFLEALKLFKDRNFAVFMIISFVVGTELEFYYILTSPFLLHLGVQGSILPWVMTIAQFAEIVVMAVLLPMLLPRLGARKMLAIGAIAWPIRYAVFALLPIKGLVIASLALHGFCYVFFFVVGFIYVDTVAPKDIRASAQSLMALVVLGLGRYLGSLFAGKVEGLFTVANMTNWQNVFLVPCFLTVVCALAFLLAFREPKRRGAEV